MSVNYVALREYLHQLTGVDTFEGDETEFCLSGTLIPTDKSDEVLSKLLLLGCTLKDNTDGIGISRVNIPCGEAVALIAEHGSDVTKVFKVDAGFYVFQLSADALEEEGLV